MVKRRSAKSYARRGPVKEPYDYVLIVCEGQKTEPNYLRRLRIAFRLSNANIKVIQAPGSDPLSIVRGAESEMQKDKYDRVFCVFDRDGHANFDSALRRIADSPTGRAGTFAAVVSWPCFEIWILLHFVYTAQAFTASGGRSPCDNVIRAIQEHYPGYAKSSEATFDAISNRLMTAVTRGRQLETHNRETGSRNPATAMHILVDYLRNLGANE